MAQSVKNREGYLKTIYDILIAEYQSRSRVQQKKNGMEDVLSQYA